MDKRKNQIEFSSAFETVDKQTGKKIIYIVADKNYIKYANKLQTLISTKNGVKSCIYTKKVYIDNMAKMSSDNIIIFIGENDISSQALPKVKNRLKNDYGMFYNWYGKRAKISRETKTMMSKRDFINYYNKVCDDFEKHLNPDGIDIKLLDIFTLHIKLDPNFPRGLPFLKKDLQFEACIMEFFNNGLDDFLKEACNDY